SQFGWRAAFCIAGLPGLLLAALALRVPDPPRGSQDEGGSGHGFPPRVGGLFAPYAPLFRNGNYLWTVAGYAAATFAAGGLAFWMPAFLERVRGASRHEATMLFGGITVAT